jgi:hypothetical protein
MTWASVAKAAGPASDVARRAHLVPGAVAAVLEQEKRGGFEQDPKSAPLLNFAAFRP